MSNLFTRYQIKIQMRNFIAGGVPKDPKIIEGWIKTRMGMEEGEQLRLMVARTMADMGHEISLHPSEAELNEAIAKTVADKSTNGFKVRRANPLTGATKQIVIEGRIVKALLKESANIVWSGQRFGPTRKFAKGYVAERLFVLEDDISLGRPEADDVHLFIGHVPGPKGEQSTLTYYEVADKPEIVFTVASLNDCLTAAQWEELLEHAELNGLGSLRSQSYGTFTLEDVVQLPTPKRRRFFTQAVAAMRAEGVPEEAIAEVAVA